MEILLYLVLSIAGAALVLAILREGAVAPLAWTSRPDAAMARRAATGLGLFMLGAVSSTAFNGVVASVHSLATRSATDPVAELAAVTDLVLPLASLTPSEPEPSQLASVEDMIERLAARLKREPKDAEGWRMLGWSLRHTGRSAEAVDAYAQAIVLAPERSEFRSAYAEALIVAAGGTMTDAARAAIESALKLNASDAQALTLLERAKSPGK